MSIPFTEIVKNNSGTVSLTCTQNNWWWWISLGCNLIRWELMKSGKEKKKKKGKYPSAMESVHNQNNSQSTNDKSTNITLLGEKWLVTRTWFHEFAIWNKSWRDCNSRQNTCNRCKNKHQTNHYTLSGRNNMMIFLFLKSRKNFLKNKNTAK